MLIIGHRGARALAPENTLAALRAGKKAGADMLEFDVRLTKDKVLVLQHDFIALRTHHDASIISRMTFEELNNRSVDHPFIPISDVLDEFFGRIILNIEIKGRGAGEALISLLKQKYIKSDKDWDAILISSFWGRELSAVRAVNTHANLALLQTENPLLFVAYHRKLNLTAVGFHRLYINDLALAIAKKAKIFTYAYTVNRPATAKRLAEHGLDGIVTDDPIRILRAIS
jgi:glycerophosphoryl diester phosphodiesterase